MLDKVEYIKSIFKIDSDNPYIVTDIAEELSKIDDFNNFRIWIKINLNHFDAQYMNPFHKFTFLIRLYQEQRLELVNAGRITKSREYAIELSTKVKSVSAYVLEKGATYHQLKTKDKREFFTSFDKSQLEKVGGLISAVNLQKSISGADALADKIEELAYELIITNTIEYKPQKKSSSSVEKLLDGVVKKI